MRKLSGEIALVAQQAAAFIRKESAAFNRSEVQQKKGYSDLVSYVDKEAEKMIAEGLNKIDSSIGFIAEEGTGERKEGLNWIIDPLDGTTNFIHQLPAYSVSIALADGETLQAGVVYDVVHNECFMADKGLGAFCGSESIRVSSATDLRQTLLATGFPYYQFDRIDDYTEILKSFMQTTRGLRRMGSAAVDLAYTACGRFDAFFEFNLNSYDVAAGALLVQEAGGLVTTFSGEKEFLFAREIVAASPGIQEEVLNKISDFWKA